MPDHTPTPWHTSTNHSITAGPDPRVGMTIARLVNASQDANAAFIVRAVNERAELVQCLEVAIYDMEERMSKDPGWRPRCLTRARAALTLARG